MPNLNLSAGAGGGAIWTTGDGAVPTAGETLTIDGVVFEWDGAGPYDPAIDPGSLNNCLDNLATKVEAAMAAGLVPRHYSASAFIGNMFLLGGADLDADLPDPTVPAPVVSASNPADPWVTKDPIPGGGQISFGTFEVTADSIAQGIAVIALPFVVKGFQVTVMRKGGGGVYVQDNAASDTFLRIPAAPLIVIQYGGASPLVAGDQVDWIAWG